MATARRFLALAVLGALAGCDGSRQTTEPSSSGTHSRARPPQDPNTKVPRPDAALIEYDVDTQTLVLYSLEDAGSRWMLYLPDQPKGVPVNAVHQFMDEVDLAKVAVFYITGTGQPSPRVTLREVLTARETRVQR